MENEMKHMKKALDMIIDEHAYQINKWGVQNHGDLYWLGILTEEVGELAREIIENKSPNTIEKELVQVAAVAATWLECLEKRKEK